MTRITPRFCALWSIVLGVLFLWFVGQWLMVLGMRLDTWSAEWTAEMKASRLQREAISLQSDFASHNCGKSWCGGCENELAVAVYDRDRSASIRRHRYRKSSDDAPYFSMPGQLFGSPFTDGMLNPVSPWRLLKQ